MLYRLLAPLFGQCPDCWMQDYDHRRHAVARSEILLAGSRGNPGPGHVIRARIECKTCGHRWSEHALCHEPQARNG